MGNNKRGKMLPEFKRKKSFFFSHGSPVSKTTVKIKHSCLCDHRHRVRSQQVVASSRILSKPTKQTKKSYQRLGRDRRERKSMHIITDKQTHTPSTNIDPTCAAVSQINVRACYFCVSQRIENLLIEPSCSSNTITTGKGADQNF